MARVVSHMLRNVHFVTECSCFIITLTIDRLAPFGRETRVLIVSEIVKSCEGNKANIIFNKYADRLLFVSARKNWPPEAARFKI